MWKKQLGDLTPAQTSSECQQFDCLWTPAALCVKIRAMTMKMQTREDFMSYLESLRGRQFSGTVRCVFEGGKIIWVYEKSDGLPDGDLKSANIRRTDGA